MNTSLFDRIEKELTTIKSMLSTLLKQNTPFSLSAHEKGRLLAMATAPMDLPANRFLLSFHLDRHSGIF